MRGDKNSRATALSKIFQEFLDRHAGDRELAKSDMDHEIGTAWQVEVVTDDQGAEFVDPDVLDKEPPHADCYQKDEMYGKARKFAEDHSVIPSADLEYDPAYEGAVSKEKESTKSSGGALAELLRKMADELEK